MTIRTDADIQKLRKADQLSEAEENLLANCLEGKETILGDGTLPRRPEPARSVRADLLRYLITGGCVNSPTQDVGVIVHGAWVTDTLDLNFACAKGATVLVRCSFEKQIDARQANLRLLSLTGSQFPGLEAKGACVESDVYLDRVKVEGTVRLADAEIGGEITARGALFSKPDGVALNAEGVRVEGGVFLGEVKSIGGEILPAAVINGSFSLGGAFIKGSLNCESAKLTSQEEFALNAQGLQVIGGVFLRGSVINGGANLAAAEIGVQFNCRNAKFSKPLKKVDFNHDSTAESHALLSQGIRVKGSVFLTDASFVGKVSFSHGWIDGALECDGAKLSNAGYEALDAQKMKVADLRWRDVGKIDGQIRLDGAAVADVDDDAKSWDLVENLSLNGFRYERLHGPVSARMRLAWVAKDAASAGEFRPQPYEQLAKAFEDMGHTSDARQVRLEKEIRLAADWRERHRSEQRELRKRRDAKPTPSEYHELQTRLAWIGVELCLIPAWHWVLRWLIGYGHAPQRALFWAVGTICVMSLLYLWVWNFGGMVPNSDIVITSPQWAAALTIDPDFPAAVWEGSATGQHYETFAALAYAADVFVPLIDLGQEAAWTATTATAWGSFAFWVTWIVKGFGWFVTALGAAAITGIIRRD